MKKKAKIILGGLFLVALVLFLVFNKSNELEAKLLAVQPRTIAKTFTEEGLVKSAQEYPLYTTFGGKIIDLRMQEGQQVQQGELLLTFDTTELRFELQQLQGQLKSVQAEQELEISKLDLAKLKQLYEIGAISQKEYEDALHTANSNYYPGQIEALRAQIESLQYKLKQSSVYAPASGIISQLDLKEGMVLASGAPLCTIYQKETYLVEGYVLTEDAIHIHPDMEVKLIQDNKEQDIRFKGLVQKIAPTAEEKMSALGLLEQRLKVTIEPELPESLILKPGYALDIEFTINKQEDKLVVPKTILFPYQGSEALWVVRENTAQIQPVETGFENERDIVIEKGLKTGDLVLLDPQLEGLKTGIRIKPTF